MQVNSYQTNRFSIQVSNSDHHPTILIGSAFQNEKVHLQESRLSLHKSLCFISELNRREACIFTEKRAKEEEFGKLSLSAISVTLKSVDLSISLASLSIKSAIQ